MNNNSWFKKEKPLLGLLGSGGGSVGAAAGGIPGPITATGGTKATPGDGYIYHLFTSPGNFTISAGDDPINCLLVGGGGGGGFDRGGGGGGGAFRPESLTAAVGTHPVIVGYAGTAGAPGVPGNPDMPAPFNGNGSGGTGGNTVLVFDSTPYIAGGGGGGGSTGGQGNGQPGNYGGSGGGAAGNAGFEAGYVGGPGSSPTPYSPYGNPGKHRANDPTASPQPVYYVGGGGGGAGAGAAPTIPNYTSWSGGSPDTPVALRNASDGKTLPWIPTAYGQGGNFSGGGGGGGGTGAGTLNAAPRPQKGGAGSGASPSADQIEVVEHTGSGGGGGAGAGSYTPGEEGAKGVVLFRYSAT